MTAAALRIMTPGLSTTVQDLGRSGFQRFGVTVGGALDPLSLRAANALAGNPPGAGVLEALYVGPSFVVEADDARLSFAGADAEIEILSDTDAQHGEVISSQRSAHVRRGQVIRVGSLKSGAVLYIAVEGGFAIEPTLGSVSTDSRGKIGGWQGRALVAGDVLPLRSTAATDRDEYRLDGLDLAPSSRVRAICGPQSDYFSPAEIERFFAGEYTVSAGSNRMGMRLDGSPIRHCRGFNITSDAIATGSIQVPGSGQPIVLLADHQTTGGYPKIATVISADLPAMGRLPIGAKISFTAATLEEAAAARRRLATEIANIGDKMVRISPPSALVAARLFECNLISGVCSAAA
ncbi:MAG TPA: biotin-dependent carboxyltransferase family protein [Xanthobacteraceae bacterium]|nr:biotin-dependent carboxyltransferase family protein [Xanthobacteraceae bacterium]